MNSKNQNTSLFQKEQVIDSLKQSFVKLNPNIMIKNPIMFTVEVSTVIMLFVTGYSAFSTSQGSFVYNRLCQAAPCVSNPHTRRQLCTRLGYRFQSRYSKAYLLHCRDQRLNGYDGTAWCRESQD